MEFLYWIFAFKFIEFLKNMQSILFRHKMNYWQLERDHTYWFHHYEYVNHKIIHLFCVLFILLNNYL